MMQVKIYRIAQTIQAVRGVLLIENEPFCVTLEDAWKNNIKNLSCIPHGRYICGKVESPKFGTTFQVKDVPNRTAILIHAGNTEFDTEGCILLGSEFSEINGKPAIIGSKEAYTRFLKVFNGVSQFELNIHNLWGI